MNTGIYNNPWERSTVTYPYVWWDDTFTNNELARIIKYCDEKGTERAGVIGTEDVEKVEKVRRCDVMFHPRNGETAWIFDKLNAVIQNLNGQFFQYDLNGYDAFQYTSYNSAEAGNYGWHMDMCLGKEHLPPNMHQPRKLSLTLLLNDPVTDFEGGDFHINLGREKDSKKIDIIKGRIICFPSYILHCVKPVTKGFRKSIVVWVVGPKHI